MNLNFKKRPSISRIFIVAGAIRLKLAFTPWDVPQVRLKYSSTTENDRYSRSNLYWSGRQDSNLRPQRPKRRALPTVPRPATVKFTTPPLKMQ